MYTIYINGDNTPIATEKEHIMERSKLVDTLRFLVEQTYGDYDMSMFDCTMEYILPISRKYKIEMLTMEPDLYVSNNNSYVEYKVPFDTALTSEAGDIEVQLTFTNSVMDEDGKIITQYVRKVEPVTVSILPIAKWADVIPDEALNSVDQRILKLQELIKEYTEVAKAFANDKADNIAIETEEGTDVKYLTLTSQGNQIGRKITMDELGDEISEETDEGLIKVII